MRHVTGKGEPAYLSIATRLPNGQVVFAVGAYVSFFHSVQVTVDIPQSVGATAFSSDVKRPGNEVDRPFVLMY
jgi:hypothetical protein